MKHIILYFDEEVHFLLVDVTDVLFEFDCDLEREEEFVLLEDTGAAIVIDVMSQSIHDITQSFCQDSIRHALLQRHLKHYEVRSQRVLVHGVNSRQV